MAVKMLAASLALILLATVVVSEIPSYLKVCGRRNPNLDNCVIQSVEGLRENLRVGMPELDVPPLEPLKLKGFPVSETEALNAYATNVKLYGLTNFETKAVHLNLEEKTVDIELIFKQVILDADYDVTAKILVPISGKGPIHIVTDDVHAKVGMRFKVVKKNGAEYIFFPTMTTKLEVKDYVADFKPAGDNPDRTVATAINAALEGGRQEILQSLRPTLERVISEEVLQLSNKVCKHFTYDELFPDRE